MCDWSCPLFLLGTCLAGIAGSGGSSGGRKSSFLLFVHNKFWPKMLSVLLCKFRVLLLSLKNLMPSMARFAMFATLNETVQGVVRIVQRTEILP